MSWVQRTVAATLASVLILSIPNCYRAVSRARQMKTLRRMVDAGARIEQGHRSLHVVDGWGNPMRIWIRSRTDYRIRAANRDGMFESGPARRGVTGFDADFVFDSGAFVQWSDDGV